MHKVLICLGSLKPMKHLKSCLQKGTLLDTIILLISISFIEIFIFGFNFDEICIL